MNILELKEEISSISWIEHVDFEQDNGEEETINNLMNLGNLITPDILDLLEEDKNYAIWVLRLCVFVKGDDSKMRAQRYIHDKNSQIQFWANMILSQE